MTDTLTPPPSLPGDLQRLWPLCKQFREAYEIAARIQAEEADNRAKFPQHGNTNWTPARGGRWSD